MRPAPSSNAVRDTIVTARQAEGWADPLASPQIGPKGGSMSGTTLVIVIVVAALVVIAAIALAVIQSRRRRALQQRFGPEYDRTVDVTDSKRKAEKELRE